MAAFHFARLAGFSRPLTMSYIPTPGVEERLQHGEDLIVGPTSGRTSAPSDELTTEWRDPWNIIAEEVARSSEINITVERMLWHDLSQELQARFEIPAQKVAGDGLQDIIRRLPSGHVLALCSLCKLQDGSLGHIPMMDFHCPPNACHLQLIQAALARLGQRKGAILESGRSYHYYGFQVLTDQEWRSFLGACLLLMPYTDTRYIAHRLISGACVLRITETERKRYVPRIAAIL